MTEPVADGQRIDQIKKNDGAAKGATEGVGFMGISIMGFGCCVILAFVSLSFCSFLPLLLLLLLSLHLFYMTIFWSSFFCFLVLFLLYSWDHPLCFFAFTLHHTTRRLLGVEKGYTKNG